MLHEVVEKIWLFASLETDLGSCYINEDNVSPQVLKTVGLCS